ncbi:Apolipoprotein N-acyltransferase [Rubripirellula obstinata]|uniref:Apolipoprotein N-acyltransferase n=1 Tax=Rubripirellula obstinata TaxID=406547 RepID=A0A5B1CM04_9BACT|nr:apolipoprotein N-acyltransferase [Rubripirellula obstinata]KAA1261362.1 Apolipoprotein N-acyltransferase [Rubripirellula obstinata]
MQTIALESGLDETKPRRLALTSLLSRVATMTATAVLVGLPWLYPHLCILGTLGWTALIVQTARQPVKAAALQGFLIGSAALSIAFHWAPFSIFETTNLSEIWARIVFGLLIGWEAIAFGLLGVASSLLYRQGKSWLWMLVPTWVVIEFWHPQVFGWAVAHTYLSVIPLIQIAAVAGTAGISAVVILACVAIAKLWLDHQTRRDWMEFLFATTIVVAIFFWGAVESNAWQQRVQSSETIDVAAVQVSPNFVGSLDKTRQLSDSVEPSADLYVWPESTLGHYHSSLSDFRDHLQVVIKSEAPNPALDPYPGNPSELLAGAKVYEDGGRDQGPYKNTALLIDRDKEICDRYVKRTLMPIGEYVPGETWFPQMRDWAAVDTELIRGTSDAPVTMKNGCKIGVLVCYEDMVAANSAATTREGAQCLISLINGSGFDDPDTLRQHLWLSQLRAVENRRAMLRCAATGITCLIHPDGQIVKQIPVEQPGVLAAVVPMETSLTIYSRFGDWFSHLATIAVAVMVLKFRTFRRSTSSTVVQS